MFLFGSPNIEKMKTKHDVQGLIKALAYQKDAKVRQAAAEALGEMKGPAAFELLVTALKNDNWKVRSGAVTALRTLKWRPGKDANGAVYWISKKSLPQCVEIGSPAIEPLVVALKDDDVELRVFAVEALGKLKCAQVIAPLIDALKDREIAVCRNAASVLGQMGERVAIDALSKALKHSDASVRASVAIALGSLGDERAIKPLLRALRDDDEKVRQAAARAFCEVKDTNVVEPLMVALRDRDWKAREAAAEALGGLGAALAVEPLLVALNDSVDSVCAAAVNALGKIGDARAVEPLLVMLKDCGVGKSAWDVMAALGKIGDARAIEPLGTFLQNSDWQVRQAAAKALAQIGDPRVIESLCAAMRAEREDRGFVEALDKLEWQPGKDVAGAKYWIIRHEFDRCIEIGAPAVEPLVAVLKNGYYEVAVRAAKTLGQLGDSRAIEPLTAMLERGSDTLRFHVEAALGQLGDPRVFDSLITGLQMDNPEQQYLAATSLGKLGDRRAVKPLIAALENEYQGIRRAAATALGQLGDPCAAEPLTKLFNSVDDPDVKQAAAEAFIKVSRPDIKQLTDLLKENNSQLRQSAANALGQMADARAVRPLINLLKDDEKEVRQSAVGALARIGVIDPLVSVLKDSNEQARRSAAEVLEKLHWQPSLDENGAWYWVIKHEWQKCIEVGTGAAGPLISVLKDGDEEVRRCAADALIKIGASSIEPLLADLRRVELLITDLKSSDRDVRRRAAQSISELRRSKTIDLRIEPLVLKIVGRMKRSHKDFENHEDSRGAYEKGCGSLVDMMAHTDFEDYSLDFPL